MEIDHDKIDEAVLALMWLTLHDGCRAWKSFDWDVTDRVSLRRGTPCEGVRDRADCRYGYPYWQSSDHPARDRRHRPSSALVREREGPHRGGELVGSPAGLGHRAAARDLEPATVCLAQGLSRGADR